MIQWLAAATLMLILLLREWSHYLETKRQQQRIRVLAEMNGRLQQERLWPPGKRLK